MEQRGLKEIVQDWLNDRASGWQVDAARDGHGQWEVTLEHEASHGLVISTGEVDEDAARESVLHALESNPEVAVASAAPLLQHREFVLGLRTLAMAFRWDHSEMRAVAFLMFEFGHLNETETAWLSGFFGTDAPGRRISPLAG